MKAINQAHILNAVDYAMEHYGKTHWFLPGTRERAIEWASHQNNIEAVISSISDALVEGRVDWKYDDPHDVMIPWGRI